MKNYMSITEATNCCPNKPHSSAVWRWCRKGIKSRSGQRVFLEHVRCGGKIFITEDALEQFFENLAQEDSLYFQNSNIETNHIKSYPESIRQARIEQAEKELKARGM
ncbi:MAG: hypothetical protein JEZ07_08055 [Phycisphaerae bacterium]|nr:hypothetical protein [Phycisphaerae bacterium]